MNDADVILSRLDEAAFRLEIARARIFSEMTVLSTAAADPVQCVLLGPIGCALEVGELRTRADSMASLVDALERFVGEVLPRIEDAVRSGDLQRGVAGLDAAARVLVAVGDVSPLGDLASDAARFVRDVADDASSALAIGGGVVVTVVALWGLSQIL